MSESEGLNTNDIAERINKSISTTERYISKLKKAGLIEFRGAPKTGGYYVLKQ
ncbi:MAG TPA: winged helix-turn-helix transcriptional regulator [Petrimonas sp.]|nr:winged helix-turn-helix transcriptional regulator [Petrimonas sp.]